jgi:excisionase family DNA binding protein
LETPTKLSLSEAAKFIGCSKGTLSKARANGGLSAKKVGNSYEIEIAELERWNNSRSKRNVSKNAQGNRLETPINPIENSALETEVEMLRERLAEKDTQIEKAEEREAHWREQCQAISALLPDMREKATEAPRERLTFMERLTGQKSS